MYRRNHNYNGTGFPESSGIRGEWEGIMTKKPAEKETGKDKSTRKGFRGEWILIILILVISGITGFLYTRAELAGSEDTGPRMEEVTPAAETDSQE